MNSREATRLQSMHRFASEAHRTMADANMSIEAVAAKIGESPNFVKRLLIGENGHTRSFRYELLADFAWATGQWLSVAITPVSDAKPDDAVESGTK